MEVRGQLAWADSLLLPCVSQGLSSDHWAWLQASLTWDISPAKNYKSIELKTTLPIEVSMDQAFKFNSYWVVQCPTNLVLVFLVILLSKPGLSTFIYIESICHWIFKLFIKVRPSLVTTIQPEPIFILSCLSVSSSRYCHQCTHSRAGLYCFTELPRFDSFFVSM